MTQPSSSIEAQLAEISRGVATLISDMRHMQAELARLRDFEARSIVPLSRITTIETAQGEMDKKLDQVERSVTMTRALVVTLGAIVTFSVSMWNQIRSLIWGS